MLKDIVFTIVAFSFLWFGAGISVDSVQKIAKYLKIPPFLISFFILGLLTSSSEISVAYFSIQDGTPGISIGNLVGASAVLVLLVIPFLAVTNKSLRIDSKTEPINFPLAYLAIVLPVFLLLDKSLTRLDGAILIFVVAVLVAITSVKSTLLEKIEDALIHNNLSLIKETFKILLGVVFVVISCKYIVDTAVFYAAKYYISPFLIGFTMLSFGTNLPELTVLVRSTLAKKKNIALGDYIGSAVFNTAILGVMGLSSKSPIYVAHGLKPNLLLLPFGALLFLVFSRNKNLDLKEGFMLLLLYILFLGLEFVI